MTDRLEKIKNYQKEYQKEYRKKMKEMKQANNVDTQEQSHQEQHVQIKQIENTKIENKNDELITELYQLREQNEKLTNFIRKQYEQQQAHHQEQPDEAVQKKVMKTGPTSFINQVATTMLITGVPVLTRYTLEILYRKYTQKLQEKSPETQQSEEFTF